MKKTLNTSISILFFSILIPMSASAHNDSNEKIETNHLLEQWNFLLAAILSIVFVIFIILIKKSKESLLKSVYFLFALIVIYLAFGSPLHLLGDQYSFSAHMLEQSLIYIVLPPLMLLGLPNKIIKPILFWGLKYKILSFLNYPLIPLILFNSLFSFYHIPIIFNTVVSNTIYHNLTHILLTGTAIFMWIPLIPVIRELDRLSEIQKIGYIFAAGMLLTPACALIIFSDTSFYTVYKDAPQLLAILPPVEDQKTGGIIMKVIQEFVYGTMIGYIFFRWAKKERLKEEAQLGKAIGS